MRSRGETAFWDVFWDFVASPRALRGKNNFFFIPSIGGFDMKKAASVSF